MQDTAKYLVHADITADGVVERSDVVGAVFGQTEGLLGDELDLRELQDASKVGRIDVEIDSQNGQSFGRITIATSLDRVETAILGASLETIDRVGPCRSTIEVRKIEDVRAAKRREVVERARTLLVESFDESMQSSRDLVEEVREAIRVEDIVEYKGLPAGPNVADSDAIVVVEGRSDVLTLLRYGIKNAIAVEGTNVPDAVAELTDSRTVTAFFDGDRGGELILRELAQVGSVDYVAFAPEDHSVEDLSRHEVMAALREKIPYERAMDAESPKEVAASTTSTTTPEEARPVESGTDVETAKTETGTESAESESTTGTDQSGATHETGDSEAEGTQTAEADSTDVTAGPDTDKEAQPNPSEAEPSDPDDGETAKPTTGSPDTLRGHVQAVIGEGADTARFLDAEFGILEETAASDAFDCLTELTERPSTVVLDGELSQRILDVAAQRGVEQIVAASTGEFVKKPTSVRVRTGDQLLATSEA